MGDGGLQSGLGFTRAAREPGAARSPAGYQVPAEGEHRAAAHFPASRPVPGGRLPVSLVLVTTCVILTRFFQGDSPDFTSWPRMSDNVVWVLGQERDGPRKRRRHEAPHLGNIRPVAQGCGATLPAPPRACSALRSRLPPLQPGWLWPPAQVAWSSRCEPPASVLTSALGGLPGLAGAQRTSLGCPGTDRTSRWLQTPRPPERGDRGTKRVSRVPGLPSPPPPQGLGLLPLRLSPKS